MPYALDYDAHAATRPMSAPPASVMTAAAVEATFDPVSYERGGAVVRQLRAWLRRGNATAPGAGGAGGAPGAWEAAPAAAAGGGDPLLAALSSYLKKHAYGAVAAADLWASLSETLEIDIAALMQEWTYAPGFPVVIVSTDARGGVWLGQAPFSAAGPAPCDPTATWWVPAPWVSSEAPGAVRWGELNACAGLRPLATTAPARGGDAGAGDGAAWVKVNAQQYGYYRVNYSVEMWAALARGAAAADANGFPVMAAVDVAGLIDDAWALANAGDLDIVVALNALRPLAARPAGEAAPWLAALPRLYEAADRAPCGGAWRAWVARALLRPFIDAAAAAPAPVAFSFLAAPAAPGAPPPSAAARVLRPALLRAAGFFGDARAGAEAASWLATLGDAGAPAVDNDARGAALEAASRGARDPAAAFAQLEAMYLAAGEPDERERLLAALAASPLAVPRALDFFLTPAVRAQDVRGAVAAAARGGGAPAARGAWDWLLANWAELTAKFGGAGDAAAGVQMGRLLQAVAAASADRGMLAEIDAAYALHAAQLGEASYRERAKESVAAAARWADLHGASLCAWVAAEGGAGAPPGGP